MALFVAPLAGFLSHKNISPKRLVQLGLLLNAVSYILLQQKLNINTTPADLVPILALMGAGMGLVMAQVNNVTLSAVSVEQAGEASGVNNTFRQIGSTLGTAVIGAILISTISSNLVSGIKDSKVIPERAKNAISSNISTQTSNVEFGGGAKVSGNLPAVIKDEITNISHSSITSANKQALSYASLIAFLGFLVSFTLPNTKNIETEQPVAVKSKK
jgi:MFS family permease